MSTPTYAEEVAAELRALVAKKRPKGTPSVLVGAVLGVTPATAATRLDGSIALDVIELTKLATWLGVELGDLLPAGGVEKASA